MQQKLKHAKPRPTAIFATNGVTGIYALRSLYSMGLETPRDIAFATIDELISEDIFQPRVTCVVPPTYEIGYRAVEVLLDRIGRNNPAGAVTRVRLPASLMARESSRLKRS